MPTQTYHGQFTLRGSQRNVRTRNELFMFSTTNAEHIVVFDWKALLRGGSFRYYAIRIQDQSLLVRANDLQDFCLLPNGGVLAIFRDVNGLNLLSLFASPEFQTTFHLNQPLPTERTTPLWRYCYNYIGVSHICHPMSIWSLSSCHPYTNTDGSTAVLCIRGSWCCYHVAIESVEGPNIFDHQMFSESEYVPDRTWALVVAELNHDDGLRIGCLRYAPEMQWESDSPQSYATFDISTANVPGWASETRPSGCLRDGQVYFSEESGRICILSKDTSLFRQEVTVFVLDFI
ncbi:hypothetical protein M407DRAFT_144718 [Tulasnella calospora MUT 4182]|uniref:Uncharacterized protein n=1 Tax=Tulasnella calospora MUT 4182 TaxID=1051891 RepID=A0A0C3PXJ1_9AGAM|nr:hypothetical protein M407DRAFT_144718 [Tulasnella calospora MUT 4182]